MPVLSIRMSEDEYDIECFDKAYDDFLKDPVTYSPDEIKRIIH